MDDIKAFITGVNSRQKNSFERIFQLFYKELVYFSGLLQKNSEDAEDVVTDVLIQLWESKYTFDNVNYLRSFLYTAVKNKTINKIHRGKKVSKDSSIFNVIPDNETIISSIVDAQVLSIINYSIDQLPDECGKIMRMILEGYSCAEIAIKLNLAPSTVRAQKRRGISILREKLPKDLFFILFSHF